MCDSSSHSIRRVSAFISAFGTKKWFDGFEIRRRSVLGPSGDEAALAGDRGCDVSLIRDTKAGDKEALLSGMFRRSPVRWTLAPPVVDAVKVRSSAAGGYRRCERAVVAAFCGGSWSKQRWQIARPTCVSGSQGRPVNSYGLDRTPRAVRPANETSSPASPGPKQRIGLLES